MTMNDRDSEGKFVKGRRSERYIHGMKGSRLYTTWRNMKTRCLNPKNGKYPNYGGRGITVCNDWMEFLPFREWANNNGYTDELTLERIDVNIGYSPSNCKFIPMSEQARNKKLLTSANTSGYCGVNKTRHGKYISRVGNYILGKRICLGTFTSPVAAAIARDLYVICHKLEMPLNFHYCEPL